MIGAVAALVVELDELLTSFSVRITAAARAAVMEHVTRELAGVERDTKPAKATKGKHLVASHKVPAGTVVEYSNTFADSSPRRTAAKVAKKLAEKAPRLTASGKRIGRPPKSAAAPVTATPVAAPTPKPPPFSNRANRGPRSRGSVRGHRATSEGALWLQ